MPQPTQAERIWDFRFCLQLKQTLPQNTFQSGGDSKSILQTEMREKQKT